VDIPASQEDVDSSTFLSVLERRSRLLKVAKPEGIKSIVGGEDDIPAD
jgi:hypothetical protein